MNALTLTAALTAALTLAACQPHDEHGAHGHDHDHATADTVAPGQPPHADASLHADHDHDSHREDGHDPHQHGAHQHGVGALALIQEGDAVMVSLTLPTDSLWGFERAPQNAQEEARVKQTLAQFSDGHDWFTFPASADCQPTDVSLTPPAGLDDPNAASHMELEAQWFWTCQGPVDAIDVALFEHYPTLHQLTLQRLNDTGSGGAELTPSTPSARW